MSLSDSHGLMPWVVGFAISAILLWLGSELFAAARSRSRGSLRLRACAVLLTGFGLGGAGHFLARLDVASDSMLPSLAGSLAWALAGLAFWTAVAATRRTLPAFAGMA